MEANPDYLWHKDMQEGALTHTLAYITTVIGGGSTQILHLRESGDTQCKSTSLQV